MKVFPAFALTASAALMALLWATPPQATVFAQQTGAPPQGKQGKGGGFGRAGTPTFSGPPAGMQALPTDLFTSKNFYKDKDLWLDKRYFRCNTPRQITDIWTSGRIGKNPPGSASWGDCNMDYPREKILSPYPYKTAKEHYEALMAKAKSAGGPTVYTKATVPDWDGWYARDPSYSDSQWTWGTINQAPTILSLLTPEYQKRMVQMNYHEGVDNAPQWNASFCYPEGFMRWWSQASQGGNFQLVMNVNQVQFLSGIAANFLRQVLIGKEHVQKVPQWYGETVGFWDGTILVTWTAHVQAWTISHSMFEYSDKLETVETYRPAYDASGKFVGLDHEAVFYDPEAFVAPLHLTMRFLRQATLDNPTRRYTYIECLSNLRNVNGRPVQLSPDSDRFIDYYGRTWAKNWEKYFEVGWEKPQDDLPKEILDIFK
ncbi:MAG TPA: hypothetical protein VKV74_12955 [Bryobacteraceae bacterium]|nr:hypothetical protein [Bryobacteraceae bacterium]